MTYADGTTLLHSKTRYATTLIGKQGAIYADRNLLESMPTQVLTDPLPENPIKLNRNKSHMQDWIDCVFSGEDPIAPVEAGARTAVICHLLALAYWKGRKLDFDPQTWSFKNDNEANTWLDYERRPGYELPHA